MSLEIIKLYDDWKICIDIWADIYKTNSEPSMITPEWINTLINVYPVESKKGIFVVIYENHTPVGITFFGFRKKVRNAFIYSKGLYLNSLGYVIPDNVWVEHNNICCKDGYREYVIEALFEFLLNDFRWNEIFIPGIDVKSKLYNILMHRIEDSDGYEFVKAKRDIDYIVDLKEIRDKNHNYIDTLRHDTRNNIKRRIRKIETLGSVAVKTAKNLDETLEWLEKLSEYNIRRMESLNVRSSFKDKGFIEFHKTYIKRAFSNGQIIMQKIMAGNTLVGIHYNITSKNVIYFYQCGYDYSINMPGIGIYCLYHDIIWSMGNGYDIYDFLAGDTRYKREMSNNHIYNEMDWIVIRRENMVFKMEDNIKRLFSGILKHIHV